MIEQALPGRKIRSTTVLVAVCDVKTETMYFGADRQMTDWNLWYGTTPSPKVSNKNKVLFAGTGACCILDDIHENLVIPSRKVDHSNSKYFYEFVFPAIVEFLRHKGYMDEKGLKMSMPTEYSSLLLVGVGSELFAVNLDSAMVSSEKLPVPYATGCGGSFAFGSLLTSKQLKPKITPQEQIKLAIYAAAALSAGCNSKLDIIHN